MLLLNPLRPLWVLRQRRHLRLLPLPLLRLVVAVNLMLLLLSPMLLLPHQRPAVRAGHVAAAGTAECAGPAPGGGRACAATCGRGDKQLVAGSVKLTMPCHVCDTQPHTRCLYVMRT